MTLEEAEKIIDSFIRSACRTEVVDLSDTMGRILAEDIVAPFDQPPFPRSPLDGYAVRSADVRGASEKAPVLLKVADEITAGCVSEKNVQPGEAVRIMTGAPIPKGADTVIRQENTDYEEYRLALGLAEGEHVPCETGRTVRIYAPSDAYQNYCFAGESFHAGERILSSGTRIGVSQTGILASLGKKRVSVYEKPRALVLSAGDELVEPGNPLQPGKIYNSNRYLMEAFLKSRGAEILHCASVQDDPEKCAEVIRAFSEQADLIVTSGGVSVGKKDIMHTVVSELKAERIFWKVGIKPGSPVLFAVLREKARGIPMFCLSGNPYALFVSMELMLRPAVSKMAGEQNLQVICLQTKMKADYTKNSPVRRFVRGFFDGEGVFPLKGSNGTLSTLRDSNCLIDIPAGSGKIEKGSEVRIRLLKND